MATGAAIIGGIAVVGAVGQAIAGGKAAEAAERGALAQLAQERETRDLALSFARMTPEELANVERAIALNEKDIERKEALLESADPALIEAGNQALQLLRGEEARTLDPIRNQRQEDRRELEDRLRAQLGTGFETSTAGIQALNDFDQGTGSLLAQEQDRSLGRLLGVTQNVANIANIGSNIDRSLNIAQLFGRVQERGIAAVTGTPIQSAAAPFVGDVLRAQSQQQLFAGLTGAATTAATVGAIFGGDFSQNGITRGGGGGSASRELGQPRTFI